MKFVIRAISLVWLTVFMLFALMWISQIFKDRNFKKEKLESPREFINDYKNRTGELPTVKEFSVNYKDSESITYRIENLKRKEYSLSVWRGEWFEYYKSKTNSYENGNSAISLLLVAIFNLLIGFIPLILIRYYSKRKIKK